MCLFRLASVAWLGCNLFGAQLYAQDCSAVLTLSRESTSAIGSDQEVKSHAQNFCREHFASQTSQRSTAYKASYKFLSGSARSGNSSESEVASKYCSALSMGQVSDRYFEQYISSINNLAYPAYAACLKSKDFEYSFNGGSPFSDEFQLVTKFIKPGAASTILKVSPSKAIQCQWQNSGEGSSVSITSPASRVLECSRSDNTKEGWVTITEENGEGKGNISIPWAPKPVINVGALDEIEERLQQTQAALEQANQRVAAIESVLSRLGSDPITATLDINGSNRLDQFSDCPPGQFVSGMAVTSAHGPKNEAPHAVIAMRFRCKSLK